MKDERIHIALDEQVVAQIAGARDLSMQEARFWLVDLISRTFAERHYPGDVGYDLPVAIGATIGPNEMVNLPTGFHIQLPQGYWSSILPRSSTPGRGIEIVTGTIDGGYRGPLYVRARNHTDAPIRVATGERLAQLVVHKIFTESWVCEFVERLEPSERGDNGFGSTNKKAPKE